LFTTNIKDDHSRVKLQQIDDDDPTSDYINANYIPVSFINGAGNSACEWHVSRETYVWLAL